MYVNYYKGMDLKSKTESEIDGRYFVSLDGSTVRYNEWGGLFGSHSPNPPKNLDLDSSIYIRRDPVDTAYSLYNRGKKIKSRRKHEEQMGLSDETFTDYVKRKQKGFTIVEHIKIHHKNWENTGIYIVDYEDLYKDPIIIMVSIEERFGLKRLQPKIELIGKVGWTPGRGIPNEGGRALDENR